MQSLDEEDGNIVLEPVYQVPEKDHWIYKNQKALTSFMRGIKDAQEGKVSTMTLDELERFIGDD